MSRIYAYALNFYFKAPNPTNKLAISPISSNIYLIKVIIYAQISHNRKLVLPFFEAIVVSRGLFLYYCYLMFLFLVSYFLTP